MKRIKSKDILNGPAELFHIRRDDQVIFAISVELVDSVNKERLLSALRKSMKAYPAFKVEVGERLFYCHYLHNKRDPYLVKGDVDLPFSFNYEKNNGYLFKTLYHEKKITFMFSHGLTDGSGALFFVYGVMKIYQGEMLRTSNLNEYVENAFARYEHEGVSKKKETKKALVSYAFSKDHPQAKRVRYSLETSRFLKKAKASNCSLTIYLLANILHAFYLTSADFQEGQAIIFGIPIDFRRRYPSKTMYNFSGAMNIPVKHHLDLHDLNHCIRYMKDAFACHFRDDQVAANMHYANTLRQLPLKITPINIKRKVLSSMSENVSHNINFSNLGRIDDQDLQCVKNMEFILPQVSSSPLSFAVLTYGHIINVNITTVVDNEAFFQRLENIFK